MTTSWIQVLAVAPDGRREALWAEPLGPDTARLLSVPVWQYSLSVGTQVRLRRGEPWFDIAEVVEPSDGATVRVIVPRGKGTASEFYLERLIPACQQRGLAVGPATFFDPRLVAVHVGRRGDWDGPVADLLEAFAAEGVIQQWEVADPDAFPTDAPEQAREYDVLVHSRPTGPKSS